MPRMLTSASNTGRSTETRTSAWAARWKITSGRRWPTRSTKSLGADVEVVEAQRAARGAGVGEVGERPGRQVVDDVDLVALGEEAVDEVRPDEARAAGHQ